MNGMVTVRQYPSSGVNRQEVFRYAGVAEPTAELSALLEDVLEEAEGQLSGQICWAEFSLAEAPEGLDLGFAQCRSQSLSRHLKDCSRIVVFAATVGMGLDRLIARYSRISPSRALMFQALGAERIESLCDGFCEEIRLRASEQGLTTVSRFSPGYGDLSLALQKDIFRVLDCPKKIGLTLNESLLMSPSKSVTAIIGIGRCPGHSGEAGCDSCEKTDCVFRRSQCESRNL